MPRPKKTKTEPGIGHNQPLNKELFERHLAEYLRLLNGPLALALAGVKAVKKREKALLAEMKKDGMKLVEFREIVALKQLESETAAMDRAETKHQYLEWAELSPGHQGDLFNIPDGEEKDKVRWNRRGYDDIYLGKLDPAGYWNDETSEYESAAIMPDVAPAYVPKERISDWLEGAREANEKINAEWLEKQERQNADFAKAAGKNAEAQDETSKEFQDADA